MKNDIRSAYEKIKVSKELENRLFAKTIYRKEKTFILKNKYNKLSVAMILIIFIALLGVGGVVAKEYIEKYRLQETIDKNGIIYQTIKVTDSVNINQSEKVDYNNIKSLKELESALGIELLFTSSLLEYEFDKCEFTFNDNNEIEKVKVSMNNIYKSDNARERIAFTIRFTTQYASEKAKNSLWSGTIGNRDIEYKNIYLKKYDLKGYYFSIFTEGTPTYRIEAIFVHNDIIYEFLGKSITEKIFMDALDNL